LRILTSTLSIAEAAWAKADELTAMTPETQAQIDHLWHGHPGVRLMEVDILMAFEAREVMRLALHHGLSSPRGADAVHLASAKRAGVGVLHTYDEKLDKYAVMLGLKIERPYADQQYLPQSEDSPTDTGAPLDEDE